MQEKEYKNIFSLISMFDEVEKVRDFFNFFCLNVKRESKRIRQNKELKYYPVIYSDKHDTLSVSFNFFIDCIAKFYDAGNEETEKCIAKDLKISLEKDRDISYKLHKNRTLIIINILQDYYSIVHPNNRIINTTYLKGNVSVKDSYFIPIVYEDKDKKPIQYEVIPMKISKLIDLGIDENLIINIKEIGRENSLNDVAFNQRAVTKYWENSNYTKRMKYE